MCVCLCVCVVCVSLFLDIFSFIRKCRLDMSKLKNEALRKLTYHSDKRVDVNLFW